MSGSTKTIQNENLVRDLTNAAATAGDAHELFLSEGRALSVSFERDKLKNIDTREESGAALRLVRSGKIGFSYTTRPQDAKDLASTAARLAPYGSPYDFTFAPAARAPAEERFNPAIEDLGPDYLVSLGKKARELAKSLVPDAAFNFGVNAASGGSRVLTSAGQDAFERYAQSSFFVSLEKNEEGNFLNLYRSRVLAEPPSEEITVAALRELAEEFRLASRSAPVSQGRSRVIFSPRVMSSLLGPAFISVNGVYIEKKISKWLEALDTRVFDERITIIDDPRAPESAAWSLFDGEGMPCERRPIIERGFLRGFIHTRASAARSGHRPTGNACRGASNPPAPGMHTVVMEAGDVERAELLRLADGGLYIDELMGVFTSNTLAGQVSGNISLGYGVSDGERTGRVKNAALNVNVFDLLNSNVVAVSKEREWTPRGCFPWLLVEDVAISAR